MSSASTPTPLPPGWGEVVPLVPPPLPPGVGLLDGRYEIQERLAWGGQAVVYRGIDTRFDRPVALKLLHRPIRARALDRLEAEALATAALRHPNLLRVLDWSAGEPGQARRPPYLVTELVTGPTLAELLHEQGRLQPEAVALIGWLLCHPLAAVHQAGLVHRDLKPANLLLDRRQVVTLLVADFGVLHWPLGNQARGEPLTAPGERIGTLEYMSPEQTRGEPIDARSDIFSLGVLLYELATGERPFGGEDPEALVAAIRRGSSPPLDDPRVPWYLRQAIDRALQGEVACRWPSMEALGAALMAGLDGDGLHQPSALLNDYFRAPQAFAQAMDAHLVHTAQGLWRMVAGRGFDLTRHPMLADLCRRALVIAPDHAELREALARIEASRPALGSPGMAAVRGGAAAAMPAPAAPAPSLLLSGGDGGRGAQEAAASAAAGSATVRPAAAAPGAGESSPRSGKRKRAGGESGGSGRGRGWGRLALGIAALMALGLVGGLGVRRLRMARRHRLDKPDALAVVLQRGHFEEALHLSAQALGRNPADPGARWNHAVALEKHTLTRLAAADFEAIGRSGDAARRAAAQEHAQALRTADAATQRAWQAMMDRGREMAAGGAIPLELVKTFPGNLRLFFYDAVRTARTAERFDALRPLAQALDRHFGGGHLQRFLDRNAALPLAARAPLAETYALLTKNPQSLGGEPLQAYLKALQAAGHSDLYMGALVFTGQVRQHVAEYRQLAKASGDPWFELIAERETAEQERIQGREAAALERLRTALERCERLQLDYRCRQLELALAVHHRLHNQLPEAAEYADAGRKHARQAGDWETEANFLWELRSIAHDSGDDVMMKLYGEEAELRDTVGCKQLQPFYRARARSAMEMHRYSDARREILAGPRCGEPRPLLTLEIMAHLKRVGLPAASVEEVQQELNALRETEQLSPAESTAADHIEGVLLLSQQPEEAERLLRHASTLAKKLSPSNVIARNAQASSDNELALREAAAGHPAQALAIFKQRWVPEPPTTCTVSIIVMDTRRLVLIQGPDGQVYQHQERDHPTIDLTAEQVVPEGLQAVLSPCAQVVMLAPPALHGRADLLRQDIAWSYYPERQRNIDIAGTVTSGQDLVLEAVRGARSPVDTSSLLGWICEGQATLLPKILRGPGVDPKQLLSDMIMAKTVVLLANGLFQEGISALSLTEQPAADTWLTAAEVQRQEFPDTPLVILSPIPAAQRLSDVREPWSLATSFLEAGVRTALVSRVDTEATRAALARIKVRIARGESAAVAVRDERLAARDPNSGLDGITAYESKP